MYERLRQILEKQNGRSYTFEEAKEIGDELVDFYNLPIQLSKERNETQDDSTAI